MTYSQINPTKVGGFLLLMGLIVLGGCSEKQKPFIKLVSDNPNPNLDIVTNVENGSIRFFVVNPTYEDFEGAVILDYDLDCFNFLEEDIFKTRVYTKSNYAYIVDFTIKPNYYQDCIQNKLDVAVRLRDNKGRLIDQQIVDITFTEQEVTGNSSPE